MRRSQILLLLFAVFCSSAGAQEMRQFLHENWIVYDTVDSAWFESEVPGVVQEELLVIEGFKDLYKYDNEVVISSYENKNWKYECLFNVGLPILSKEHVELHFEGLDTYAEVYLNDSLILSANNQFLEYKVEVKSLLKVEENSLEIRFTSPQNKHIQTLEEAPHELPSGCEEGKYNVGVYSRKAPYQFGWDWGPRCVTVGPWKPISLRAWSEARISDVRSQTLSVKGAEVLQSIDIEIEGDSIQGKVLELGFGDYKESILLHKNQTHVHRELTLDSSMLWWPVGMGESHLIPVKASVLKPSDTISTMHKKVGLRTVELVQTPDSMGTPYYFKINGVPVFCKGANYIPQHIMPHTVTQTEKEMLLKQACDANMNMIRVWGGGIYETDEFYSACDRLGLMVWQDFMFAGSIYPANEEFQSLCIQEANEQVKKLSNHPSVVLWCGNNELDVAFHNWGWQDKFNISEEQSQRLYAGYERLFKKEFSAIVKANGNGIPYVHTSPLSNWGTQENFNHGSMHYWGVWHGREGFSEYKNNVGRFMVEYGFQSFPDADFLSRYVPEDQWNLESEAITSRQRSYIGNGLISTHCEELFGKPKGFDEFIEYSQYTQAEAMRIAISAHRLNTGKCMGTLFWQLNDCWPGPSWSAIQSNGEVKPVYQEIKKLFSPTIAVIDTTDQVFSIHLISDENRIRNVELEVICFRDGIQKSSEFFPVSINYLEVKEVLSAKKKKWDGSRTRKDLSYQLVVREGNEIIFHDFWFEVPLERWRKQ